MTRFNVPQPTETTVGAPLRNALQVRLPWRVPAGGAALLGLRPLQQDVI